MNNLFDSTATGELVFRSAIAALIISCCTFVWLRFWVKNAPRYRSFVLRITFLALAVVPVLSASSIAFNFGWGFRTAGQEIPPLVESTAQVHQEKGPGLSEVDSGSTESTPFIEMNGSVVSNSLADKISLLNVIGTLWLLGCLVVVIRLFRGLLWVRAMVRNARPLTKVENSRLIGMADSKSMPFLIRSSPVSVVPFLTGLIRPVIVIPSSLFTKLSDKELNLVIQHEAAHFRHKDHHLLVLQQMVAALYWWNPAVKWLNKQLSQTHEELCDFVVTNAKPSQLVDEYRHLLLSISESCCRPPSNACALAVSAEYKTLKDRLNRIGRREESDFRTPGWIRITLTSLTAALFTFSLSCQADSDEKKIEQEQTAPAERQASIEPRSGQEEKVTETNTSSQKQILIVSKFIEVDSEITDLPFEQASHVVITESQARDFFRKCEQHKGTDIIAAPSITVVNGQDAKIELTQEVATLNDRPPGEGDEKLNSGIMLSIKASIKEGGIHLAGNAIIRVLDENPAKPKSGNSTNPAAVPQLDGAISFNTIETYFSKNIAENETLILQCKRSDKQKGQTFIAISAQIMDAPPSLGISPSVKIRSLKLAFSEKEFEAMDPNLKLPERYRKTIQSGDTELFFELVAIFGASEGDRVTKALASAQGVDLQEQAVIVIPDGSPHPIVIGGQSLMMRPKIGPDAFNIDWLFFPSRNEKAVKENRRLKGGHEISVWNEQWVVLKSISGTEPGNVELVFIQTSLVPSPPKE